MSKAREKKVELVGQLEEKVKRAKMLVFADYRGLKHQQLERLKKALKATQGELLVAKNTLLTLALEKSTTSEKTPRDTRGTLDTRDTLALKGPTAALFAYEDVIAPLKELAKMMKELKLPTIKFAILDGKTISAEQVVRLASLPSREVLIAQVVGGMKAPIYGLHRAMRWNIQKLVITLKAIEQKKA